MYHSHHKTGERRNSARDLALIDRLLAPSPAAGRAGEGAPRARIHPPKTAERNQFNRQILIHSIRALIILLIAAASSTTTTPAAEPPSIAPSPQPISTPPAVAPNILGDLAARLIAAEIPREYEGTKDWGRTTQIVTGLHSYGNFFKFDIHRQRSTVNDGLWKRYRLTLVDPDKNLDVQIENLRTLDTGRVALTLNIAAKLHGWARLKLYERGVHIIALEAEGDTGIRLALDANIGLTKLQTDSFLPAYALDPAVTDVRVKFADFRLTRISDVRGTLAHEIGILFREAVEDELKGPKLTEKINKSIAKHRERLELSPEALLDKATHKPVHGNHNNQ